MTGTVIDLRGLSPIERAQLAAELGQEAVRDKSYQHTPLGEDVAVYMRARRRTLTDSSQRSYEGTLHKLVLDFAHLTVEDFEPPVGAERLERFLDDRWGGSAPGTFNVCHAHVSDFFDFWLLRGRLQGDPMRLVPRAKKRDPMRHVFSDETRHAILGNATELRDRIAIRLLFDYGLRKGALGAIRFKHFDHQRRRLTIITKGGHIRSLPLPDPALWRELERLILDWEAEPDHFLMCVIKPIPRAGVRRFPTRQMASTTLHRWWMARLADAGLVPRGSTGTKREMNMHAARHTAGQRVLDTTGNLKAVQRLLGHASIATTGDVYVDHDEGQLARSLMETFARDAEG